MMVLSEVCLGIAADSFLGRPRRSVPNLYHFNRYPLRVIDLTAFLALRGDSVTGVKARYNRKTTLSTVSYERVVPLSKSVMKRAPGLIPGIIHS